jgi:hypothetical protein
MNRRITRWVIELPRWLRPAIGLAAFAGVPLVVGVSIARALGGTFRPGALDALQGMFLAGLGAALAYGVAASALSRGHRATPWVVAFITSLAMSAGLALWTQSTPYPMDSLQITLGVVGCGTLCGGALLRQFQKH